MSKVKVAKHTPGPWIYYPNADYFLVDGGPGQTRGIAKTYDEDNAALIAAAPELLEALKTAKLCLRENRGPSMDEFRQIQTAISKAEGGK